MLINKVLVSGVQQSDSIIRIHVSILFQVFFPLRLLQHIEHISLYYTVGPFCLFSYYLCVCFIFIYLAALGLSCSSWALISSLQREGSFSCDLWTLSWDIRDLVPWPGIEPGPLIESFESYPLGHRGSLYCLCWCSLTLSFLLVSEILLRLAPKCAFVIFL